MTVNKVRRLLVAALMAGPPLAVAADPVIKLVTSRTNGPHHPLALALVKLMSKAGPALKASAQATKDPVESLALLETGRADIAFALGDSLSAAWQGNESAGFNSPLRHLRGIASLYPNYIQIVARTDSGVRSLRDLKGKRVSVGAPRSVAEQDARTILSAAGIAYRDFGKLEYLPFGESVELIKDRRLDATLQSTTMGGLALRDLATSVDMVIVPVPLEVLRRINDPAFLKATIPANTYRGQAHDVPTAAVMTVLVTREAVSEETVYATIRALSNGLDELRAAHPAAAGIDPKNLTLGMVVPLHPGAERYYRDIGLLK